MSKRKIAREVLASLIQADANAVQTVYPYQAAQLKGESPVVCITSGGSRREPLTLRGSLPTFLLDVHIFVLYSGGGDDWTAQDAEDTLDLVEEQLGGIVDRHRKSQAWQRMVYADSSDASTPVTIDGMTYLHERVSLEVLCP